MHKDMRILYYMYVLFYVCEEKNNVGNVQNAQKKKTAEMNPFTFIEFLFVCVCAIGHFMRHARKSQTTAKNIPMRTMNERYFIGAMINVSFHILILNS